MTERLLILLVVAALALLAVLALRAAGAVRRRRARHLTLPAQLVMSARPLLLVFSTPGCADCRYRQAPAIERVQEALGATIEIRSVDAAREPGLAAHFGILTAPSTVIVDPAGHVAARNDGFAPADTLLAQLRPLLAASSVAASAC